MSRPPSTQSPHHGQSRPAPASTSGPRPGSSAPGARPAPAPAPSSSSASSQPARPAPAAAAAAAAAAARSPTHRAAPLAQPINSPPPQRNNGNIVLPSFSPTLLELLSQSPTKPPTFTFIPLDFVHATFPLISTTNNSRLDRYLKQLRRTVGDLSKSAAVVDEVSIVRVKSSLESLFDNYMILLESLASITQVNAEDVKRAEEIAAANNNNGGDNASNNASLAELKHEASQLKLVKLHCVHTVRALRNLHIYIQTVEIMQEMLHDRDIPSLRICFQALHELLPTLQPYVNLPLLQSLVCRVDGYKLLLRAEIFRLWKTCMETGIEGEDNAQLAMKSTLYHTTRMIDLLFTNFERKELIKWFVSIQMKSYDAMLSKLASPSPNAATSATTPSSASGVSPTGAAASGAFADLDALFLWLFSTLKVYDREYSAIFPRAWYVDAILSRTHFEKVHTYLTKQIQQNQDKSNVDFYKPLLSTIEFEGTIRARWPDLSDAQLFDVYLDRVSSINTTGGSNSSVSSKRDDLQDADEEFVFQGFLSGAFTPILSSFIISERQRFYEYLELLEEEENWEVETSELTLHFTAADKIFIMVQKSIERYSKILSNDYFLDLFKEFYTALLNYLELLHKHLPGLNSSSSGDGLLPQLEATRGLMQEEISALCATINTDDYIQDRCKSLETTVLSMLSSSLGIDLHNIEDNEDIETEQKNILIQLKETINFQLVEEQIQKLNYKATHILALNLVSKLQPSLHALKEGKGLGISTSGSINDENKYIKDMINILRSELQPKAKMSSFAYLCQVVVTTLCPLYLASLKKSSFKITELIAQQMLMNLQELKNFMCSVPEIKRQMIMDHGNDQTGNVNLQPVRSPSVAGFKPYLKIVNKEFAPLENILKILTVQNYMLIETTRNLNEKVTTKEIMEILNMRGLTSSEQSKLIKTYNSQQTNPKLMIEVEKKNFMGQMHQLVTDVKKQIN